MSLSNAERLEITEIVDTVFRVHFDQLKKEIIGGYIEVMDWYTDNLAKLLMAQNAEYEKLIARMREAPNRPTVKGFSK